MTEDAAGIEHVLPPDAPSHSITYESNTYEAAMRITSEPRQLPYSSGSDMEQSAEKILSS